MRAELAKRLRRALPGLTIAKTGVTGVAGVTGRSGLRPKTPGVTPATPATPRNRQWGKGAKEGVAAGVTAPLVDDLDAIEERAALADDCVPARYLDAWARLECQKPFKRFRMRMAAGDR